MIKIVRKKFPLPLTSSLVALTVVIAFWFRAILPYHNIFSGNWIKFSDPDSFYHMRLVENLLTHFPHSINFDPFTYFPHGTTVFWPPFFDWLMASIIRLLDSGSPSQRLIESVGAYFPAILGTLTVIPVYFIGKEVFNRWVGLLAAALAAILPSEFLSRSLLGNPDHHVAEVLFTTLAILFLIRAIKSARKNQVTFNHVSRRDWKMLRGTLINSAAAGIFLGIYLLSWVGGPLFILLLFIYFIVQSIVDQSRRIPIDYLGIIGPVLFTVAAAISLPFLTEAMNRNLSFPALAIAGLAPVALTFISGFLEKRGSGPTYYPLVLAGFVLLAAALVFIIDPAFFKSMLNKLEIFTPSGAALFISEVQPALNVAGRFSFSYVWATLTTGFFLSLISLGFLLFLIIKRGDPGKTLVFCWSLLMLLATLGQRRFEYYFTICAALLTAYVSLRALSLFGYKYREDTDDPAGIPFEKETRPKKKSVPKINFSAGKLRLGLGGILVFFVAVFPNISPAITLAGTAAPNSSDAWYSALYWLKDNSPDPFGDPSYYYSEYQPPPAGQDFTYPETAYGVMASWEYGHMITDLAHRIPISNPFQQGAPDSSQYFTSIDSDSADEIMDKLGGRYVLVDDATAYSKFFDEVGYAGGNLSDYYETYYQVVSGKLEPVVFFYPDYYLSTAVRLYLFNGKSDDFQQSTVISFSDQTAQGGAGVRVITDYQFFNTYGEAKAYVASQKSGNYRIGNFNPSVSPVPIAEFSHYTVVYQSEGLVPSGTLKGTPAVKIFQYEP